MNQAESFRCYYEDGTIFVSPDCPQYNNGSPLIDSEFQIVEDVYAKDQQFPYLLVILVVLYSLSKQKGK